MSFNELNTTEHYILNELTGASPEVLQDANYRAPESAFQAGTGMWQYVPSVQLKRDTSNALVESLVIDALVRLNPDIAADPSKAEEVLHKIRAIFLSVGTSGLVRANEEFSAWLRSEKSMPFGENNEHVTINLIDFDNPENNTYIATNQYTVQGRAEKRPDIVMLVNGIPLVVGEFKTPVRPAISWLDGTMDIHDDYENTIPQLFVPNVFSFSTEGKTFRYGSIRMPLELWGPWRDSAGRAAGLSEMKQSLGALKPSVVLDMLQNFTLFATDKRKQRIKIIARYQQLEGANLIVDRVKNGHPKKGLLWHFQGSGKSLLRAF